MAEGQRDPEKYVRESYTMRPAAKWQVWAMTAAGVVVVVLLLAYVMG
jgi:hypothetical protein